MKFIKNILFFFLLSSQIHAQYGEQIKLDSLISQMKSGELNPEGKVKLYNKLFYDNFFKDKSKAIRYNTILYNISKKYNRNSGVGDYFLNIAFLKYSKSDYKSALFYSNKSSEIYLKDKDYDNYLRAIARQCFYMNTLGMDVESFQLASDKIKKFDNYVAFSGLGDLYEIVSGYYLKNKNYTKSLKNTQKALLIYQKSKFYNGIVECNLFIADILYDLEDYNGSLKYVETINDLPDEFKKTDSFKILYSWHMARNHLQIGNYQTVIRYANKAISLLEKSNFGLYMIELNLYKADSYQKLGDNKKALNIILNSENDIQKYITDPESEGILKYINLIKSNIYFDLKQYKLALINLQKNLKFKDVDAETYENISRIQYKLNQYKEAFENQKKIYDKKIKQLKVNQKNNLDELHIKYNVEENQFKIQNLKIQNLSNDLKIKTQREDIKNIIIIAVILFIGLIFGIYIYRIRIKVSQILKYKNEKLENINELLNKSLREKDILLKEIHHRVKNNLQLVSSILNIQANDSPDISVAEFLDKCQNRISSIALIHQNLYVTENLDKVDFQTYIEELANCILASFSDKEKIRYEILANSNQFNIQTSISLGLIISELSCNAIKYAFKEINEGIIYIELINLGEDKYELIFGDNGCGQIDKTETSVSIGLELVSLLAMQLNGEVVKLDRLGTFYRIAFEEIKN